MTYLFSTLAYTYPQPQFKMLFAIFREKQTSGPLVLYRSPGCWGYAELDQTCKFMSTQCCIGYHRYRSSRKQIWPSHKNGQGQPRVINWKNAPGHGHTSTYYKFWQHFKAFIIPIVFYQFQKDPFCLIFCFISYTYIYILRARGDNPWGQFFWWKQKGLLTLITGCMFQKIALPSYFMHIFSSLGTKFWCQQESLITLVICCKFKKISSTSDFIHIFSWFNKCI